LGHVSASHLTTMKRDEALSWWHGRPLLGCDGGPSGASLGLRSRLGSTSVRSTMTGGSRCRWRFVSINPYREPPPSSPRPLTSAHQGHKVQQRRAPTGTHCCRTGRVKRSRPARHALSCPCTSKSTCAANRVNSKRRGLNDRAEDVHGVQSGGPGPELQRRPAPAHGLAAPDIGSWPHMAVVEREACSFAGLERGCVLLEGEPPQQEGGLPTHRWAAHGTKGGARASVGQSFTHQRLRHVPYITAA